MGKDVNERNYKDHLYGYLRTPENAVTYLGSASDDYKDTNDIKVFLVALMNVVNAYNVKDSKV